MNDENNNNNATAKASRFNRMRFVVIAFALAGVSALMLGQGDYDSPSSETSGSAKPAPKSDAQAKAKAKAKSTVITSVPPGTEYNQREQLLMRGELVYQKYCIGCHGPQGDGKGPAAVRLITQPRDFTKGIYKFRTTDSSSLPMEADLHRTITRGLARVSMPGFPLMAEQDRVAVIQYIKNFYKDWDADAPGRKLVFVPNAPQDLNTKERITRGRAVYLAMGCANCHGKDGAGTDAVQSVFTDAWGHPQQAFNFTRGRLKSGDDPEDIYRVFHAGLRSIMPSFPGDTLAYASAEAVQSSSRFYVEGEPANLKDAIASLPATTADVQSFSPQERLDRAVSNSWDMVAYVQSLRSGGGVATAKPVAKKEAAPPAKSNPDDDY